MDLRVNAAFAEFFRRARDQFLFVLNYIPDVIGQRSGGKGDKLPLLQHRDVQRRIGPFCFRRRGPPAGASANNHQIPAHQNLPTYFVAADTRLRQRIIAIPASIIRMHNTCPMVLNPRTNPRCASGSRKNSMTKRTRP